MTRALVLYAHPLPDSLSAHLHRTVVATLLERGVEVDDLDLYADGFDPLLGEGDRRVYHDLAHNQQRIAPYVQRLQHADALILCHPVWNFGWPAVMKGWFDRVFLPGVSFRLVDGELAPGLTNIRTLVTVTTYGATRLRALYLGDPPRMNATRFLRVVCHPDVRTRYLALYGINRGTGPRVEVFAARIRRTLTELF
jgi:NAD(P)H dehydrogenase (quinone)